jgi:hypothetical protein
MISPEAVSPVLVSVLESPIGKQNGCWGEPEGPPQRPDSSSLSGHRLAICYLVELRPRRRPARKPPREPVTLPVLYAQVTIPTMTAKTNSDSIVPPLVCE